MAFVSCPTCDEEVRLPAADLPKGFSAECPWCGHAHPIDQWAKGLPPKVKLFNAEGEAVPWPKESSSSEPLSAEPEFDSQSVAALAEIDPAVVRSIPLVADDSELSTPVVEESSDAVAMVDSETVSVKAVETASDQDESAADQPANADAFVPDPGVIDSEVTVSDVVAAQQDLDGGDQAIVALPEMPSDVIEAPVGAGESPVQDVSVSGDTYTDHSASSLTVTDLESSTVPSIPGDLDSLEMMIADYEAPVTSVVSETVEATDAVDSQSQEQPETDAIDGTTPLIETEGPIEAVESIEASEAVESGGDSVETESEIQAPLSIDTPVDFELHAPESGVETIESELQLDDSQLEIESDSTDAIASSVADESEAGSDDEILLEHTEIEVEGEAESFLELEKPADDSSSEQSQFKPDDVAFDESLNSFSSADEFEETSTPADDHSVEPASALETPVDGLSEGRADSVETDLVESGAAEGEDSWSPSSESGMLEFGGHGQLAEKGDGIDADDSESSAPSSRPKVPFADDQRSYYRRHKWGERPPIHKRLAKYALPAALLTPAVGAAVLFSGNAPNIGVYPLDGSFNGDASKIASSGPKSVTGVDQATVQNPDAGNEPPGVDQTDSGTVAGDSEVSSKSESSNESQTSDALDRVPEPIATPEDSGSVSLSEAASEQIKRFEVANELAREADAKVQAGQYTDLGPSPTEDIEAWIDDAINRSDLDTGAGANPDSSPLTDLMEREAELARQQREANREPEKVAEKLSKSLLVFPRDAPKLSDIKSSGQTPNVDETPDAGKSSNVDETSVQQASAVSEIDLPATETLDDVANKIPVLPAPSAGSDADSQTPVPAEESFGENLIDSVELVEACQQAASSLDDLDSLLRTGSLKGNEQLKLVKAYRDVAQVGEMTMDSSSPSVALLLSKLIRISDLTPFEALPIDWLKYSKRPTDGIVLVGQLTSDGRAGVFELTSGQKYSIRNAAGSSIPNGKYVVALGRIVENQDAPLIELVAGEVVQ